MRLSLPPIRGNLLGVKRFSTFLIFLSLLSGFFAGRSMAARKILYRLSLSLNVKFERAMRRFVSIEQSTALIRND
jgi:hypothetical protein